MTEHNPLFSGLNEQQLEAVNTLQGPLLILAGAGSGKTRTLTHRIAHLMAQGIPPWQILAVTFTNKAAKEMKERIKRILHITTGEDLPFAIDAKGGGGKLPVSGTFHSICVRMLRRDIEHIGRGKDFVIYDSDDQERLMKVVLKDMKIAPEDIKPRTALSHIGHFKCEAMDIATARNQAGTYTEKRMAEIFELYQKKLREHNALDFDDLIVETVRLLRECPDVLARYQNTWRYLHVDEYQDTNRAQYLLISLLAKAHRNICVIGDPDQSIYAFRGADIRNILDFTEEYKDARAIKLERNYRSTQQILDAADAVIEANPRRPEKKMWTERKDGAKVSMKEVMDERREAEEAVKSILQKKREGVPLHEQVILYRTNAQSRLFEEACLRAGVPYRILGGLKFYARREVKDVLAYLYTILNPSDTVSLLRIINVPARKIGDTTLSKLQEFGNEKAMGLWQVLKHIDLVPNLSEAVKNRLAEFVLIIEEGQQRAEKGNVHDLTEWLIEKIGMERWLRDDTDEGEARWENVLELLSVTKKYDALAPKESLTSFLEEVALVSEVDKLTAEGQDALTLMTLHLCKGLEFRNVTIVGCEEGLLPHSSAQFDREQMEEERRLLYVGMTRAKDTLTLMHAASRTTWGNNQSNPRSRFLDDIPHTVVTVQSDDLSSSYGWLQPGPHPGRFTATPLHSSGEGAGVRADDDFNQEWLGHVEEILNEGTRIEHKSLGRGTVLKRSGDVIEVKFDAGATKRLALGIAPVKVVSE